ncbi:MAG: hypothetical protein SGARI_002589 [Bacillariaceae sp.]
MTARSFFTVCLAISAVCAANAAREEYFSASSADSAGYLTWLSTKGIWYSNDAFVASNVPGEGSAVFWEFVEEVADADTNVTTSSNATIANSTVDGGGMTIQMAVAVPATGWVALGFTLTGVMADSDIFVYDLTAPDVVADYYISATSPRTPMGDACQNWELLDVTIDGSWTIVEVSRSLDTLDTQDLVVGASNTAMLISAWDDFTNFGYHGPNKGVQSVSLFGNATAMDMIDTPLNQTTLFGSASTECY